MRKGQIGLVMGLLVVGPTLAIAGPPPRPLNNAASAIETAKMVCRGHAGGPLSGWQAERSGDYWKVWSKENDEGFSAIVYIPLLKELPAAPCGMNLSPYWLRMP